MASGCSGFLTDGMLVSEMNRLILSPFSSPLSPASCLCTELKLDEVHSASHPVCEENSFQSFHMETPLSEDEKVTMLFWGN